MSKPFGRGVVDRITGLMHERGISFYLNYDKIPADGGKQQVLAINWFDTDSCGAPVHNPLKPDSLLSELTFLDAEIGMPIEP